jgi:hypothetical protein
VFRKNECETGLVVAYDKKGKNPTVIQETPSVRQFALAELEEGRAHSHEDELMHIENEIHDLPKDKLRILIEHLSRHL